MTQQEPDEALRILLRRKSEAKENWSAALTKLQNYGKMCAELGNNLNCLMLDASLQESGVEVPDNIPSSVEIKRLLSELKDSLKEIKECNKLLNGFGINED